MSGGAASEASSTASTPQVVSGSVATSPGPDADCIRVDLESKTRHLALPDVNEMLDVLTRKKNLLESEADGTHHKLLYEFLTQLLGNRTRQLQQLSREVALVKKDIEHVAGVLRDQRASAAELWQLPSLNARDVRPRLGEPGETAPRSPQAEEEESFTSTDGGTGVTLAAWRRRLTEHFNDFVQCYFDHRTDELHVPGSGSTTPRPPGPSPSPSAGPIRGATLADLVLQQAFNAETKASSTTGNQCAPEGGSPPISATSASVPAPSVASDVLVTGNGEGYGGLEAFREDLAEFTGYQTLRPLVTLSYCSDAINYSTIVSTIEFDKDNEFFAVASPTKQIDVLEFEGVVRDTEDAYYPCLKMQCSQMVSDVSWNAYHKNVFVSSDYEGTVSVWDASTGVRTRSLQEHDRRCWSVHFNCANGHLLASGSDDARVKLWSLNSERSVATLEAKFNVSCVRFNPGSSYHLAFGSADHCVYYYDIRALRAPLVVFRDHRKAGVSYVKFVDARTLVSASTDSQLKLWNVESPRCVRSFTGHTNEKYFVGLATDGRYVACGSEDNALYMYYKRLSRPLLAYSFNAVQGSLDDEGVDKKPAKFVSAVCWRRTTDQLALLAANSQGTIKVFELV